MCWLQRGKTNPSNSGGGKQRAHSRRQASELGLHVGGNQGPTEAAPPELHLGAVFLGLLFEGRDSSEGLGWGSGLCISNLKSCLKCPGSGLSAGKPLRNSGLCKHQQTYLCDTFRAYIENKSIYTVFSKIYFTLEYLIFSPMEYFWEPC